MKVGRSHMPKWQVTKTPKQGFWMGGLYLLLAFFSWLGVALTDAGYLALLAGGWSVLGIGYVVSSLARAKHIRADGEAEA